MAVMKSGNMAIVTVGELLDRGRAFELRMQAYYAEIRDHSANHDVRLLTYYLARHARHHEMAFGGMAPDVLQRVREVKLNLDAPFTASAGLHLPDSPPRTVKGKELLDAAVGYDKKLVDLYRSILAHPLIDDARAAFDKLVAVEERDIVMLTRMLAMHYF